MKTVTILNETYRILDWNVYNDRSRRALGHPKFQLGVLRTLAKEGITEKVDKETCSTITATTTLTQSNVYTIKKKKSLLSDKTIYILTIHTLPDSFTYIITDPTSFENKALTLTDAQLNNPVLFHKAMKDLKFPLRSLELG